MGLAGISWAALSLTQLCTVEWDLAELGSADLSCLGLGSAGISWSGWGRLD